MYYTDDLRHTKECAAVTVPDGLDLIQATHKAFSGRKFRVP